MPFASALVPVVIQPDGTYCLSAHVVYQGRDETFTIPAGFVTDLASVPRFMSWLVPIAGVHDRAAILHDFLCTELAAHYRHQWFRNGEPAGPPASARDTDGIFRRVLRELGVGLVRRWLFFVGVRWGALANPARRPGWLNWRDTPAVVGISLLALPFVLLPGLLTGLVVLIDNAVERFR